MIEFHDVHVDAEGPEGSVGILRGVSLALTERRVALIGPNGSGKSTLARLVNGLVLPTRGSVLVNGLDVATEGRAVRRQVGFAFTDPSAQLVMPTAIEDVALSLRRRHRDKEQREQAAQGILEEYRIGELARRSVHSLSGGQRQLLALAGVLATEPAILVADEPTTLLDLANARRIGALLLGLSQQLVLATHDLELAGRCDRALLVDGGQVVADGVPVEVIAHYRSLVEQREPA
ncbi:ABC transporter ATP-binding protein [Nocardioides dubius]|uniref:ABC transporter ATP-binding protein n=1 Tax=Nocardioides dubius TaxID=317019 RepID=A0ABN1TYY6_9ACTN